MAVSTYTAEQFARDVAGAMEYDEAEARAHTRLAMERACASPALMAGHEERMAGVLEYELLKTPHAAIKVFVLRPQPVAGVPHDHAGLWGCYAAHTGAYWMETFRETDERGERVEPLERRLLQPGEVRFVEPDVIHAVWSDAPCFLLTAYNGDLNALPRRIFDRTNGRMIRGRSRWEERHRGGGMNFDLTDE